MVRQAERVPGGAAEPAVTRRSGAPTTALGRPDQAAAVRAGTAPEAQDPRRLLALQRAAGNRATASLLIAGTLQRQSATLLDDPPQEFAVDAEPAGGAAGEADLMSTPPGDATSPPGTGPTAPADAATAGETAPPAEEVAESSMGPTTEPVGAEGQSGLPAAPAGAPATSPDAPTPPVGASAPAPSGAASPAGGATMEREPAAPSPEATEPLVCADPEAVREEALLALVDPGPSLAETWGPPGSPQRQAKVDEAIDAAQYLETMAGAGGMAAVQGLATLGTEKLAVSVAARAGLGQAAKIAGPAGAIIGGVPALIALCQQDWGEYEATVAAFNTGEGYELAANRWTAIAAVLDTAGNLIDVMAAGAGAFALAGALLSFVPGLQFFIPAVALATDIAIAGGMAGMALAAVKIVCQLLARHYREQHLLTMELRDERTMRAQQAAITDGTRQIWGFVGGVAGGAAATGIGAAGGKLVEAGRPPRTEVPGGVDPGTISARRDMSPQRLETVRRLDDRLGRRPTTRGDVDPAAARRAAVDERAAATDAASAHRAETRRTDTAAAAEVAPSKAASAEAAGRVEALEATRSEREAVAREAHRPIEAAARREAQARYEASLARHAEAQAAYDGAQARLGAIDDLGPRREAVAVQEARAGEAARRAETQRAAADATRRELTRTDAEMARLREEVTTHVEAARRYEEVSAAADRPVLAYEFARSERRRAEAAGARLDEAAARADRLRATLAEQDATARAAVAEHANALDAVATAQRELAATHRTAAIADEAGTGGEAAARIEAVNAVHATYDALQHASVTTRAAVREWEFRDIELRDARASAARAEEAVRTAQEAEARIAAAEQQHIDAHTAEVAAQVRPPTTGLAALPLRVGEHVAAPGDTGSNWAGILAHDQVTAPAPVPAGRPPMPSARIDDLNAAIPAAATVAAAAEADAATLRHEAAERAAQEEQLRGLDEGLGALTADATDVRTGLAEKDAQRTRLEASQQELDAAGGDGPGKLQEVGPFVSLIGRILTYMGYLDHPALPDGVQSAGRTMERSGGDIVSGVADTGAALGGHEADSAAARSEQAAGRAGLDAAREQIPAADAERSEAGAGVTTMLTGSIEAKEAATGGAAANEQVAARARAAGRAAVSERDSAVAEFDAWGREQHTARSEATENAVESLIEGGYEITERPAP